MIRSLAWVAFTVALAASVLAAVILPANSFVVVGSGIAVAASTVVMVALCQPVRLRIQGLVDRRFYRSRYDAGRVLEAFSTRLRDEVDLEAVRHDLVSAAQRTVQPAQASVWIRGEDR